MTDGFVVDPAPFDNLDRVVHEPARLLLLAILSEVDAADFRFLKNQTRTTGGNLSFHLNKLEAAGLVKMEKTFVRKKTPRTLVRLTQPGRTALQNYRGLLDAILKMLAA